MKITKISLILALSLMMAVPAWALSGVWHGAISMPGGRLPLVLRVGNGPSARLDSPMQGAYDMVADKVDVKGDSLHLIISAIGLEYRGVLKDGNIEGALTQGGASLPLTFEPGEGDAVKRPQTPKPPFPYREQPLKFASDALGGAELSGTLALPDGARTAVVFVTGSGLQDRDETICGHKPFAVIADFLARQGVASLRYDDRGFGDSTGAETVDQATTDVFAVDAKASVAALRALGTFERVGVIGHSEGGSVAVMLAKDGAVDFAIGLAAPALPGDTILTEQNRAILLQSGVPAETVAKYCDVFNNVAKFIAKYGKTPMNGAYVASQTASWAKEGIEATLADNMLKASAQMATPWMRNFLKYDPADDIAAVRCPTLLVYGEKDSQVPAQPCAAVVEPLAKTNTNLSVAVLPGLNHLMQPAQTGAVSEYPFIEQTVSEEALELLKNFFQKK